MLDEGILNTAKYKTVGYPKFDTVQTNSGTRRLSFRNDKPVILYNPHFSPHLSSWYKMGGKILEYFCDSDTYNLIFAPHLMLFTRRIHLSQEKITLGKAGEGPARCFSSPACADMTYTMAADIYLGDASSQVWEFLLQPRPCLFINAHHHIWDNDPNFYHWRNRPVIDDISELDDGLRQAVSSHPVYQPSQECLFRETFDINKEKSSIRAANAILNFLENSSLA